jgi:hypothetical protein
MRTGREWNRHWPALLLALLVVAAVLPLLPAAPPAPRHAAPAAEWPAEWEGRVLRPLASSAVEQRFAQRFPGAIGRFTDGERVLVLRRVDAPTRMLHPAADCFRGIGRRIEAIRLEQDAEGRLWRRFDAVAADGERLHVAERIVGSDGTAFVDASAWFWSALAGRSAGPWLAVTVVEAS